MAIAIAITICNKNFDRNCSHRIRLIFRHIEYKMHKILMVQNYINKIVVCIYFRIVYAVVVEYDADESSMRNKTNDKTSFSLNFRFGWLFWHFSL